MKQLFRCLLSAAFVMVMAYQPLRAAEIVGLPDPDAIQYTLELRVYESTCRSCGSEGFALADSFAPIERALAKAEVTRLHSAYATTVDGRPIPVSVTTTKRYLARTTLHGGKEESEFDDIVTGFSATLTPMSLADGSAVVSVEVDFSRLVEMREVEGTPIQLPRVVRFGALQRIRMQVGQYAHISSVQNGTRLHFVVGLAKADKPDARLAQP